MIKIFKVAGVFKDKTRFGLFSSSFSLVLILIVIKTSLFGNLDLFVREYATNQIIAGLLFFGILFMINDLINLLSHYAILL